MCVTARVLHIFHVDRILLGKKKIVTWTRPNKAITGRNARMLAIKGEDELAEKTGSS